jgi:hypothetical protein
MFIVIVWSPCPLPVPGTVFFQRAEIPAQGQGPNVESLPGELAIHARGLPRAPAWKNPLTILLDSVVSTLSNPSASPHWPMIVVLTAFHRLDSIA